jgi:hypothetical protein
VLSVAVSRSLCWLTRYLKRSVSCGTRLVCKKVTPGFYDTSYILLRLGDNKGLFIRRFVYCRCKLLNIYRNQNSSKKLSREVEQTLYSDIILRSYGKKVNLAAMLSKLQNDGITFKTYHFQNLSPPTLHIFSYFYKSVSSCSSNP